MNGGFYSIVGAMVVRKCHPYTQAARDALYATVYFSEDKASTINLCHMPQMRIHQMWPSAISIGYTQLPTTRILAINKSLKQ